MELFGFNNRRPTSAVGQSQRFSRPTTTSAPSHSFTSANHAIQPRSSLALDGPIGFYNADHSPSSFDPHSSSSTESRRKKAATSISANVKKSVTRGGKSTRGGQSSSSSSSYSNPSNTDNGQHSSSFTDSYRQQQQEIARGMPAGAAGTSSFPSSTSFSSSTPSWHWTSNASNSSSSSAFPISSSRSSTDPSNVTCYRCQQVGHYANACTQSSSSSSSASSSSFSRHPPTSAPNNRGRGGGRNGAPTGRSSRAGRSTSSAGSSTSNGLCYKCNQSGHWASNCPNGWHIRYRHQAYEYIRYCLILKCRL